MIGSLEFWSDVIGQFRFWYVLVGSFMKLTTKNKKFRLKIV